MDSSNLVLNKFALPNGLFSDVSIVSTDEKCKSLELHYLVGFDLGALNARFDVSLFSFGITCEKQWEQNYRRENSCD